MTRIRMIMLSLLAAFAVSAVASASASAANDHWNVANGTLPKNIESMGAGQKTWKLAWNTFETQCTKVTAEGAKIALLGANSATGLKFETCTVTKPGGEVCEVEGGFIKTKAVTSQLEEEGVPIKHFVNFKPTVGTEFVEFKLKNITLNGCGLIVGAHKVKGTAKCEVPETNAEVETEKEKHKLECNVSKASGELKVGAESASLEGSLELKVSTGENWSG